MKAEGLGRAISHVAMKSILGYKTMFLCNTDVKFQFMLDGTIQAEAGKTVTSLKDSQRNKRLCKAIVEGRRFDYLLVDSWFPCAELL